MRDRIKKLLRESFDEFGDWFNETEPTFKNFNFEFDGKHEYWIDISRLNADEHELIFNYIKKTVPYSRLGNTESQFRRFGAFNGIVIHCANEDNDYYPEKDYICFMTEKFSDDQNTKDSLYVDGGEVLEYIKAINKNNLKESLSWGDKDTFLTNLSFSNTDANFGEDLSSKTDPKKSYWEKSEEGGSKSSSSDGGGETVTEEEDLESEEDPFYWLRDAEEHPNYNGHPQGVVYLYNHDEIDEFCDIIENYNGGVLPRGDARHNLHNGLEFRRNDLEADERDISEAVLSVSFFVERKDPGVLSVGYWDYDVDPETIREWLKYDDTFNQEYRLYTNLNQVRKVFEDYQNPEL